MTISNQRKLAGYIIRLLKVNDIIFPIGRTNKGNFGIRFSANGEDFEMYLDAVPLSTKDVLNDDNNIELKKMVEKYLFELPPVIQFEDRIITPVNWKCEVKDCADEIKHTHSSYTPPQEV